MDLQKRTWAEIHLDNIAHNYTRIRSALPQGTRFLGVVKADAYGHGAVAVSRRLEALGADYLAVSCLDEALELRQADIHLPILILGHTPPAYVPILLAHDITQTVTCEAKAIEYAQAAQAAGGVLRVHIKLDTGMSRLGFLLHDFDAGVQNVLHAISLPNLDPEGVFTHFAVSDEPGVEARDYTQRQFSLFMRVIEAVEARSGFRFRLRHCANSGAVLTYPETCLDMVRPGLLLYGYGDGTGKLGLLPCMDLITTVSTIKHYEAGTRISYGGLYETTRRTRMGVLPIGYADGLFRSLSNRCAFWCEGSLIPQRGRICMDMCMADLTDRPDISLDSRVEIFGTHASLDALAQAAGTIPYELLCSVSKRVPRVYLPA